MRASTAAYLVALLTTLAVLGWSVRRVSSDGSQSGRRIVTFACWGNAQELDELRQLVIDPINGRQGRFEVKLIEVPGSFQTKLMTMMAGDIAPDLFYLSQEHVPALAGQGALLDLTDMVANDDDPVTDLAEYYPAVLNVYKHQGRLYGLPWIAAPVIVYCNADMFASAGVPLPDRYWDWDRFVEIARQLTRDTDGDGQSDQWGFVLKPGWPPHLMWVWQNGADIVDPATGRVSLENDQVVAALDFARQLIHEYQVAPPLSVVSEIGFSDLFRAGKVAMFMGGAADDLDRLEGMHVVAAEPPTGPSGLRATFAWSAGLHISRHTSDPSITFDAWKQVLHGIQEWKIPAPRRRLAARLESFEPRKAASAQVIKASMAYMRSPTVIDEQIRFETLFAEEFLDKLLRAGTGARQLVEQTRPRLERWQ